MKGMKRIISFVLAIAMVLSLITSEKQTVYADVNTYISSCTAYPSSLTVKTKWISTLMTYPCSSSTNSESKVSCKVTKGTMLNVYELYKNTAGEYWYKIIRYGKTMYMKATDADMMSHLVGDVTITDPVSPATLGIGMSFPIGGKITSTYNEISSITAAMYTGIDKTVKPYMSSSDNVNGKSYELKGSAVDNNLVFNNLEKGDYTYLVTAKVISYYVDSKGALQKSTKNVQVEEKRCIITDASSPNPVAAKGIDVSFWQGNIDWSKVATAVDFVIFRAAYGTSTDTQFYNYANGCTANNIPFGVYVYSIAMNVSEAKAEAEHVVSLLKNYNLKLPVYFDFEDEDQVSIAASTKKAMVQTFVDTVKAAGYEAGLYASLSWFNSYFSDSYYDTLPKWVAQYYTKCTHTRGVRMWQYTDSGSVSGISGNVDCNYYYGTFPGTNPDTSYLSQCTRYDSSMRIKTNEELVVKKYPCYYAVNNASSDVTTVAASTTLQVTGLYKNTIGEYWYQIEQGSTYGYLPASRVTVTEYKYDDIYVLNPQMADNLSVGSSYPIQGKLKSRYNQMEKIYTKIYAGENTTGTPVLSSEDTPRTKEYSLKGSTVDNNLIFGNLSSGYYTYEISTDIRTYYIDSTNTLKSIAKNVVLWKKTFTVGANTISHSHSNVNDNAVSASCTATGLTAGTHCSVCNEITKEQTVVAKKDHTKSASVKENEVAGVSYDLVVYCSVCKVELSRENIKIEPETTSKQETETTSKQEEETTSKQEEETTSKQETETTSKQETETTSKQEEETTSKQEEETTSKQETETTSKQETETTSKQEEETSSKQEEETTSKEIDNIKTKLRETFLVSTIKDCTYTGNAITQNIVLKDGNKTLVKGVDYKVEFVNNENVGTAVVIVDGIGSYSGSIVKRFTIMKKAVSNAKVTLSGSKYKYTGNYIKPGVTVKDSNKVLRKNVDYTVIYSDNVTPGKATVTIIFENNYSGKAEQTFVITPLKVIGQKQSALTTKSLTIKWKKNNGVTGYEVFRASKKKGTYVKVKTIKGNSPIFKQDKLKPSTKYYYKIRAYKQVGKSYIYGELSNPIIAYTKPATTSVKAVAGNKRVKLTWKKVTKVDGYEIYMSTSKNGKYKKIATKKVSAKEFTKTKLRSGRKYYFKIRTYVKVSGGKKIYSGYSSVKSIKVK